MLLHGQAEAATALQEAKESIAKFENELVSKFDHYLEVELRSFVECECDDGRLVSGATSGLRRRRKLAAGPTGASVLGCLAS